MTLNTIKKQWLLFLIFISSLSFSQHILPQKERAKVIDEILVDRFNNLLPSLMDRTGIDLWVIISREYNEDPVLKTMLPATWLNARRRTILVFYRDQSKNSIEKLAIARYDIGQNIKSVWNKEREPDQWKALMQLIQEKNPKKIGLNFSDHFGLADGLVKTDHETFMKYLPKSKHKKVVSAEKLAIGWIETRTEREMVIYDQLVTITHNIIAEAFSEKVITPGITSTEDVVWWMRDKVTSLGLKTWFHPTVDVQRNENSDLYAFDNKPKMDIIRPGDLLHCDFGITYLRLNTDCQELAYVLRPDEIVAPKELQLALTEGNRLQDILTNNFKVGRSGNEILLSALKKAKSEGLKPQIYTHPLGFYGHSAGPTIGMWDAQQGVPFTGDYSLYPNTVYAIELNTKVFIKEWNKEIRVMLEEAGFFGVNGHRYVNGRQTELLLIPRVRSHLGN